MTSPARIHRSVPLDPHVRSTLMPSSSALHLHLRGVRMSPLSRTWRNRDPTAPSTEAARARVHSSWTWVRTWASHGTPARAFALCMSANGPASPPTCAHRMNVSAAPHVQHSRSLIGLHGGDCHFWRQKRQATTTTTPTTSPIDAAAANAAREEEEIAWRGRRGGQQRKTLKVASRRSSCAAR